MTFLDIAYSNTTIKIVREELQAPSATGTLSVAMDVTAGIPAYLNDGSVVEIYDFMYSGQMSGAFCLVPKDTDIRETDIVVDERPNAAADNEGPGRTFRVREAVRIRGGLHQVVWIQCRLEEEKGAEDLYDDLVAT